MDRNEVQQDKYILDNCVLPILWQEFVVQTPNGLWGIHTFAHKNLLDRISQCILYILYICTPLN